MSGSEKRAATVEKGERGREGERKGGTEQEKRELVRVKLRYSAKRGWLGVGVLGLGGLQDMQHGEECGRGKE